MKMEGFIIDITWTLIALLKYSDRIKIRLFQKKTKKKLWSDKEYLYYTR